jgi:Zn-dependent peptidase ImmA (M78 family)/DNA-binding XRE family transcriptional regulator
MTTNAFDRIDLRTLGKELQTARKSRGLSQEEVANAIAVARTTLTAIEKGERRIRPDELIKLAHIYGRQVSDFVRARPNAETLEQMQPRFRGPVQINDADNLQLQSSISDFFELIRDYLELESILDEPLARRYPPEYSINEPFSDQLAESIAIQERMRLGLGDGPIANLRDTLEQEVGLRIFYLPLKPSKFSAVYVYNDVVGGCIGVNSLHPTERQAWSLVHDYGHFLTARYQPVTSAIDAYQRIPQEERLVDAFAKHFLMPSAGLTRRYHDIRRAKNKFTPADVVSLADYYKVSVEALTLRLESLKLLPTGTWDRLKDRGFKVGEAKLQLGISSKLAKNGLLPQKYEWLAVKAFNDEKITEGRLSKFLRRSRIEARLLVESDVNAFPELPSLFAEEVK